jgi:hypothetical protein
MSSSDEQREALEQLSDALAVLGIVARGVRDMPQGPALTVLVNLIVTHDGTDYVWREGLTDQSHPGNDAQGAAEAIAALASRLQGPVFQAGHPTGENRRTP